MVLETNRPYLIPLKERLALPADVRGKANPKSSTGRLDVFTRVITDESYRFDEIAFGYDGPLYLEVVPLSFPVRVREDLTLNQLRLSVGHPELSDDDVRRSHREQPLLFNDGEPVGGRPARAGERHVPEPGSPRRRGRPSRIPGPRQRAAARCHPRRRRSIPSRTGRR